MPKENICYFLDGDDELYSNETLKEIDEHIKENKYDIIYFGYENVGHTENYYRISTKENSTREARLICDESFSVSNKVWNVEFLRIIILDLKKECITKMSYFQ